MCIKKLLYTIKRLEKRVEALEKKNAELELRFPNRPNIEIKFNNDKFSSSIKNLGLAIHDIPLKEKDLKNNKFQQFLSKLSSLHN